MVFKIAKSEFKVTIHYGQWAKCTQLWPLKHLFIPSFSLGDCIFLNNVPDVQSYLFHVSFIFVNQGISVHIQIPPDRQRRSHMMQYRWGYCKLEYWGYFEGTLHLPWQLYRSCSNYSVPSKYPQRYSNCSSLSVTASYKTYMSGQEESGCVIHN